MDGQQPQIEFLSCHILGKPINLDNHRIPFALFQSPTDQGLGVHMDGQQLIKFATFLDLS